MTDFKHETSDNIDKIIEEITNNGWKILNKEELIRIWNKNRYDSEITFSSFYDTFVRDLRERVYHYDINGEILDIIYANRHNPYSIDVIKLVKSEEEKYEMLKQLLEKLTHIEQK